MSEINKAIAKVISDLRYFQSLSQEELADEAGIHRTYISQIERELKSPTLQVLMRIAKAFSVKSSYIVKAIETQLQMKNNKYKIQSSFQIDVGFSVNTKNINDAVIQTNIIIADLPPSLFKSIDYKTTSAIIGAIFCDTLASITNSIVNPIEKGHPDLIPSVGANATEEKLRNYPQGLEIKCTIGNVKTGANLRVGESRIEKLTGITWQAHHREVKELLGLTWDFVNTEDQSFNYPTITAVFYSNQLISDDWGAISGTEGRNTKVTAMLASGKTKMGNGWIILLDKINYLAKYQRFLKFSLNKNLPE